MALKSLAFALAVLTASSAAPADTWTVDPEKSSLGFEVVQGSGTLAGRFDAWTARIEFDPQSPETAVISAEIRTPSAATGNPQFDQMLPTPDWFDAAGFPVAEFRTEKVSRVSETGYRADGTLTIRQDTRPVVLDFTLAIDGDTAHAKGTAQLKRSAFGLGAGVGTDTVGDDVTVTLDLTATR